MAFNPAKQGEALNSPVERASNLNDPQFENQQGYFPYDLTHCEYVSPLFGQITPTMHLDTVPGDRTVVHDNVKTILNQINGNFLSTMNQYVDSFYVPLRSVFPNNYEKLIPNPVKGDDLPNTALPQVPFAAFIMDCLYSSSSLSVDGETFIPSEIASAIENHYNNDVIGDLEEIGRIPVGFYLARMALLCTVLSRGQLLDYLGISFDDPYTTKVDVTSSLQESIDKFFDALYEVRGTYSTTSGKIRPIEIPMSGTEVSLDSLDDLYQASTLSQWRSTLADIFEKGQLPNLIPQSEDLSVISELLYSAGEILGVINNIFGDWGLSDEYINRQWMTDIDNASDPFADGSFINIGKILAYQQVVAHYYTNDSIDNIFSAELFMQNLRSIMFPKTEDGFTTEPVFDYNGVATEYDYISAGGFITSLMKETILGHLNRQVLWLSVMCLMRRSLRYGDYFSTARPNMLAISDQLGINVEGGQVSPIDVTKNLLMQRYLNAANYIGQGFLQYMSNIYGIKPSDTGCTPRFVAHRKIVLNNQITNNTADDQGKQTTNLVGYADSNAFDVFIDDLGYLITMTSYDVLPVYSSGIENTYHFADRFDYFNPMLQGIGDQPIRGSEILGAPFLRQSVFGYTMRNAEYKYKLSKAHGAFVNSLPGFLLKFPLEQYRTDFEDFDNHINPDFIRDKPSYIDSIIPQMTGTSPANYYHFICACNNQVLCARKIQATPGVLF